MNFRTAVNLLEFTGMVPLQSVWGLIGSAMKRNCAQSVPLGGKEVSLISVETSTVAIERSERLLHRCFAGVYPLRST